MDIETNNRNTEKFIPHPILDDPDRMMRIIANPVYDKLTLSRAAQIRKQNPIESTRKSVQMIIPKEKLSLTPVKSFDSDETIITPLTTDNNQSQLKSSSKRQNPPLFPQLTRSSTHRIPPKNLKLSPGSRNSLINSFLLEHDKKSATDNTIRYVKSRHGFEVQRYSSPNWLTIDLLANDACQSEEKTFRQMLDKKEQNEHSSHIIYTTEYYRQRWEDLLQSYKEGHLTHDQWARQNYQLHCLRTLYIQAFEREQYLMDLQEQNQRQNRAKNVFNTWKEGKIEGNNERRQSCLNTSNSRRTTDVTSVLSNASSSQPQHAINRMSIVSIADNDLEELPIFRMINRPKKPTVISRTSYMLDEHRWSLNAMLKRVVGLAEPLPPPPKLIKRQNSIITNLSNDSGFESGP